MRARAKECDCVRVAGFAKLLHKLLNKESRQRVRAATVVKM